jgi:hypothetical protein
MLTQHFTMSFHAIQSAEGSRARQGKSWCVRSLTWSSVLLLYAHAVDMMEYRSLFGLSCQGDLCVQGAFFCLFLVDV